MKAISWRKKMPLLTRRMKISRRKKKEQKAIERKCIIILF